MLAILSTLLMILLVAVFIGAGAAVIVFLLKFLLSIPIGLYIGANRYHLEQNGFDTKDNNLPKMSKILRFYIRLITFRRPLLP